MELWMIALLAVVALLLAVFVWRRRQAAAALTESPAASDRVDTLTGWPPTATRIMTTAERLAYSTLTRGMPGHMVLAQVPLARFLKVPMRNSYTEWLRRMGHQCADLVVCDMASQVIAVVHVQPTTGESSERARKRLSRMKRVLRAAEIPLHTWNEGALPTPEEAQRRILTDPSATAPAPLSSGSIPFDTAAAPPPAAAGPAPAERPAYTFDDPTRDPTPDEVIEVREPPQSTWFDEFDSRPAPLKSTTRTPRKP